MNQTDFVQMKKRLDSLQTEKSKAEGALESEMKRLKDEFGYKSVEEATAFIKKQEKVLEEKQKKVDRLLQELDEAISEVEDKLHNG